MVNGTVGAVVDTAQSYFYLIVVGVVILLVGFALGFLIKKLLIRVLKEVELNKAVNKIGLPYNAESIISNIVSYTVYLITIVLFLNQLGITSVVIYIVVVALLLLLLLSVLVGLRDVLPNFISGIVIQRKKKFKVGKIVEVNEISGTIEKIGFLETEIKTKKGDLLHVPNSLFRRSKF